MDLKISIKGKYYITIRRAYIIIIYTPMYLGSIKLSNRLKTFVIPVVKFSSKPTSSEVLTAYLIQCNEPPWTSYFVKYSSVKDDQFGMSNFNWNVGESNYQILRTGCYPYIKYHCSRKAAEDLESSDKLMRIIKVANLGIPCLLYGIAAKMLIRHSEVVHTSKGSVTIYFLLPEHKGIEYTTGRAITVHEMPIQFIQVVRELNSNDRFMKICEPTCT